MEENSCSDNLSNFGQGPSPTKQPAQFLPASIAPLNIAVTSMTPMPKLMQAFSLPVRPRNCSNTSSDLLSADQKQALMQAEFMGRERVQRLKQDLIETPNSKYKYKQISREMKEQEKNGF